MRLNRAITDTFRSKKFWLWQIGGVIIYGIPVAIRFATGSVHLPILGLLETPVVDHYVPSNLVEKILVNAFFPGGAGGVAGETLVSNYKGEAIRGKTKYLARLGGALAQTSAWSMFQYWGYYLWISGPHGSGNLFEHSVVFPLNFTLAAFSIFTPDVVNFVKSKMASVYRKLSKRKNNSAKKT